MYISNKLLQSLRRILSHIFMPNVMCSQHKELLFTLIIYMIVCNNYMFQSVPEFIG